MDNNIKKFAKGEVIFKEGALELFMYDLIEGKVGIYANYGEANEKLLTELSAEAGGVTFGEMGLIDAMPRSATAVALENVQACAITGKEFGAHFKENPAAVLAIMQNMSKRIRKLTQDYLDACRAVAETVDSEKTGKEKSRWLLEKMDKFIKDYEYTLNEASKYGCDVYCHFLPGQFW